MKVEALKQRLKQSATDLRQILNTLDSITSPSLHTDCQDEFRQLDQMADILASTCSLIEAKEYARQLLQKLPLIADSSTDVVDYHRIEIPFSTARLLGFQGYLSTTWAICDSIIPEIALLLFSKSVGKSRSSPPNLLTQLVKNDAVAHYNSSFLLKNYGWPIAVSYVIRNHFVHDGASYCGYDFFTGKGKTDEYQISLTSSRGWSFLEEQMKKKHNEVKKEYTRLTDPWTWHHYKLLKLLEVCNDEIDEALSCLVGWSVGMATLQARYLLERDFSPILSPPTSS